jgi:hypothetical protein
MKIRLKVLIPIIIIIAAAGIIVGLPLKEKICVINAAKEAPEPINKLLKETKWDNVDHRIAILKTLAELKENQWENEINKWAILQARMILKKCGIKY